MPSMAIKFLPALCSRLTIFLSYASEQRAVAEKIAQSLINDGHVVFFDKVSLTPSGNYEQTIREAIRTSDRFVFLASRKALTPGRFTLTELQFAKEKWPSPVGHVLPVIIEPGLKPEEMSSYLSSVHAFQAVGNTSTELSAALLAGAGVRGICKACVAITTGLVALGAALAIGLLPTTLWTKANDMTLTAPDYVIFRPRAQPPVNPAATGSDVSWTRSPLTITLPVSYASRNPAVPGAQATGEEAVITLGGKSHRHVWTYIVDITGSSVAGSTCAEWLCQKATVKPEPLKPGEVSTTRQTMFMPAPDMELAWGAFIDAVLAADGPERFTVALNTRLAPSGGGEPRMLHANCIVDAAGARRRMLDAGFRPGYDPRPATWQPRCLQN